jgi:hypothetical protein
LINLGGSELPVKNRNSTPLTVRVPKWTTMPLSFLPPNTAIHISSSTMWCLKIGAEITAQAVENYGAGIWPFSMVYGSVVHITGVQDGWSLQSYDRIKSTLFHKAGINVSEFHDGLMSLGFDFAPHQAARINLWTLDRSEYTTGEHHAYRGSIKQPGGWDKPWGELHDKGNVLVGRDVSASEMARYLH